MARAAMIKQWIAKLGTILHWPRTDYLLLTERSLVDLIFTLGKKRDD